MRREVVLRLPFPNPRVFRLGGSAVADTLGYDVTGFQPVINEAR